MLRRLYCGLRDGGVVHCSNLRTFRCASWDLIRQPPFSGSVGKREYIHSSCERTFLISEAACFPLEEYVKRTASALLVPAQMAGPPVLSSLLRFRVSFTSSPLCRAPERAARLCFFCTSWSIFTHGTTSWRGCFIIVCYCHVLLKVRASCC